jgi:endonuclease/exonuclease/phosphatase family metal-dependent hydrolase
MPAKNKTPRHSITTSVALPVELRVCLEHLRLARAQRGMKLPRLRDLVLEALNALVAGEAQPA